MGLKEASGNTVEISKLTETELVREKRRIVRDVVFVSLSFMVLFTAFNSMAALQSSINKVDGLGTYSLSVIYAFCIISNTFLPSFLIKKLTVKWTAVISMFCYSAYIAAQFYPQFYTLIPAAVLLGLAAAPLWTSKCTYVTRIARKYAEISGEASEVVVIRFFGIFSFIFQLSGVWGNAISSTVLSAGKNSSAADISVESLLECGVNFCPSSDAHKNNSSENETIGENFAISEGKVYTLAGIFLILALISAVMFALLVDPLTRYGEKDSSAPGKSDLSGTQLFFAMLNHMRKPYQILIIPLTIWTAFSMGFFWADFTAGYITCACGVENIGYIIINFSLCNSVFSYLFSLAVKFVGRITMFVFAMTINLTVIVVLFSWMPSPDQVYVLYLLAALWGVADAAWGPQLNALYGVLFVDDEAAAFSNHGVWGSLGFIFTYILETKVCMRAKLWILIFVLLLGMVGYLTIEVLEHLRKGKIHPKIHPT